MERGDTRNTILSIGLDLIALQGYHATGIDQILKKAGIPKGSFYHYFQSKEDFGFALIDQFAVYYKNLMERFLLNQEVPALQRIRDYMLDGRRWFIENNHERGCLIGNLGQELADQNPRFRARLDEVFSTWRELFAACLLEAQKKGQLSKKPNHKILADFVLSGWEGAILRAKVAKSPQPITDFIEVLFATALKSD
jgi:TetR/AcrR family transcriptional repressor of nem operon